MDGIGDAITQVLRLAGIIILMLIIGFVFLCYKQCGNDKVVTNKAIVPVIKIVTTNINGVIKTDTTYIT